MDRKRGFAIRRALMPSRRKKESTKKDSCVDSSLDLATRTRRRHERARSSFRSGAHGRRYANTKFAGPAGASGGPCTARPVLSTLMSPALIPLSCAASPAAAVRRGRGSPCHSNSAQLSSTQTPEPHLPPPSSERSPHASPPSPPRAAHLRGRPSMNPVE